MTDTQTNSGSVVWGQVKWYDAVKGYGFVVPDDGGPDIMVHASCVRAFGKMTLAEGARVRILAGQGQRGLNAQELLEVEEPESPAPAPGFSEDTRPTEYLGPDVAVGPLVPARVKWFDKPK